MLGGQPNRIRIGLRPRARYIYALTDPRDGEVHYIGVTKNVYTRLEQHVNYTSGTESKRAWINELEQEGLSPELDVLETIEAGLDVDLVAQEREKHWIFEFLKSGAPLLNVSGVPHANPRLSAFTPSTPFGRARLRAGLSAAQLAKEAKVSSALISSIERGKPVKPELAVRVCRVLSQYLGYEVTYKSLNIKTCR